MRGYFGLGQLSATEKQDILDQHKSLYNGYQTMQPQVSNTQPLYTYDFAGDKDGMVVNNKGEVKKYTNMGINEQYEKAGVCEQCGGTMREDVCEQCGGKMEGEVEEGVGKLDDIYDEEDLNPSAGFDYIEGPSNSVDTFEKMHKNLYKEDEYEDDDNENDGDENLQVGDQLDEQGYTGGGNAPNMDINIEPAYNFRSNGPDEVYPTEGEMEEQTPEDNTRYRRRGITYDNLLSFIDYEKTQWDACHDFSDEFEYADNIISSAIDNFFAETGQDYENDDLFDELHDICKDWFGQELLSSYYEECGGQEEEEEEDFMFMESAFADEIDEVDVSGSQGIYGEMDPPYDFDSEGPGKAGPYQRTSYNEEEMSEGDVPSRFESFYNRFLTKEYGSVEPIESDDKISFMKNGDEVFTYYKKLKGPTLSHHVSGFLRNIFGFNFDDTEDIFDKWFSKHFNLEVDFNRKDYIRNYIKNQKLKIKTYNQFFGLKKPKNWGKGDDITVDTIKDQIVGDLTDGYDLSGINKEVVKHGVDRFAQKWYNDVRNLDYDSAIYKTDYISETDDWDEFLGEIGIYGEMEPPYVFDPEGPGKAGPYQRSSYYEEEDEDEESEEDFELDEDLKESFMNQKEKVLKMMSRMKVIK
jgi:hypothetical protein